MISEMELFRKLEEIKAINLIAVKEALTMDDAVAITGLAKSYLYKLCQKSKIPHYKSRGGKYTYFRKSELNNWMLHTQIRTAEECMKLAQ